MATNKKIKNLSTVTEQTEEQEIIKKVKPVLLLDLDGVINIFEYNKIPLECYGYHTFNDGFTIIVAIPQGTTKYIQELNELYEIHWCTAWKKDANLHISPRIGLPTNLPVVPGVSGRHYKENKTWKLPFIQDYISQNLKYRKVAYIDDDIFEDCFKWVDMHKDNLLFIKTNPNKGITEVEMDLLRNFAKEE